MKLFSTVLLSLLSLSLIAQSSLKEVNPVSFPSNGFVVTKSGNKIQGKISAEKVMSYHEEENVLLEEISFSTYSGTAVTYKAENIKSFSQKRPFALKNFEGFTSVDPNFAHFQSMPHPTEKGKSVFAEKLMDGKVEVFASPKKIEKNETGGLVVEEDDKSYFVIKNGGEVIFLTEDNYEKNFDLMFADCDEMGDFLNRHPQMLDFKSFHVLVELYNNHFSCK
jgi:hypothetical protein